MKITIEFFVNIFLWHCASIITTCFNEFSIFVAYINNAKITNSTLTKQNQQ